MTSGVAAFDLEDLARRYDAQVMRQYLLEQEPRRSHLGALHAASAAAAAAAAEALALSQPPTPLLEVFELRPRCFSRLRALLLLNFVVFWSVVSLCTYLFHLRVEESGLGAVPPMFAGLLGFCALGTQSTVELAAAACLTRPAVAADARLGLCARDCAAWLCGLGARTAILLDVLCLPLMWRGSQLLFLLSFSVSCFAIGVFVVVVQLRLLCGLLCANDHFSYDKPDLLFKGRDVHAGATEGPRIAAAAPESPAAALAGEEEAGAASGRLAADCAVPFPAIKAANLAHLSDLSLLHAVLQRLYIPPGCQETQEFITSITAFSRCYCQDVVQCSLKFFFLMDCKSNVLVLCSLLLSVGHSLANCWLSTTSAMDPRTDDGDETEEDANE
eukprot:TRINITY_DN21408_c0_g1_i2.p1 TRINITY_DN21408_c0_g1~~TRINITY_DN21408_c0_g1_i2.p1  ORF type:complete len:408 (+),score=87.04 TRINITY_DN21408_c0_g1_i2:66-1226(+)